MQIGGESVFYILSISGGLKVELSCVTQGLHVLVYWAIPKKSLFSDIPFFLSKIHIWNFFWAMLWSRA